MREPDKVMEICRAITASSGRPPSIKCRIGVDGLEPVDFLQPFLDRMCRAGVEHVSIHARKAILGLNPTKNRSVPPLMPEVVHTAVDMNPYLRLTLNGGIRTLAEAREHIDRWGVHGVMIGRQAYHEPWLLADADRVMFGKGNAGGSREEVLEAYGAYADQWCESAAHGQQKMSGVVRTLLKPLAGFFYGTRVNSAWRQHLHESQHETCLTSTDARPGEIIAEGVRLLRHGDEGAEVLDERPADG